MFWLALQTMPQSLMGENVPDHQDRLDKKYVKIDAKFYTLMFLQLVIKI